ncbi:MULTISPECIES: hypothetical protein [unclassified Acinetobacter]|uniref:hypothetical protein n=1 Tax=unclassified Acinetobacter TaxID=196816 RepID=UPI00124D385F|nr:MULTISPECIES: hypothetical protein [unclassified Acinetobacter]
MPFTFKTVFRMFFALIIFLTTFALFLTCFAKGKDIWQADQNFAAAQTFKMNSSPEQTLVLLSNNKAPDEHIYLHVANQGYIAKLSCDHYLTDICVDDYNEQHTRQIQSIELFKAGPFNYIQQVSYLDTRTQQIKTLRYTAEQIQQFYRADVSNLKYVIFGVLLFALIALYVSVRIARNFKQFLNR